MSRTVKGEISSSASTSWNQWNEAKKFSSLKTPTACARPRQPARKHSNVLGLGARPVGSRVTKSTKCTPRNVGESNVGCSSNVNRGESNASFRVERTLLRKPSASPPLPHHTIFDPPTFFLSVDIAGTLFLRSVITNCKQHSWDCLKCRHFTPEVSRDKKQKCKGCWDLSAGHQSTSFLERVEALFAFPFALFCPLNTLVARK